MAEQFAVRKVFYDIHKKEDAKRGIIYSLRVRYICVGGVSFCEWVGFEYTGYPLEKAVRWWKLRTDIPFPSTVAEAHRIASQGLLREPVAIVVDWKEGKKFPDVIDHIFAP